MRKICCLLIILPFMACNNSKKPALKYPETKKVQQIDDYFGTKVADSYRWLENDTSKETAVWVAQQNKVTNDYLAQIPFREKIRERLTKIWDYPKYGTPFKEGDYYFFFKNDGMQNQSVLYIQKGLEGTPEVFLDPNKLSSDGTTALAGYQVSNNKKYFAYSISKGGSDWNEIFVMDIETKKTLNDHLEWIKFSGMAWQGDGFYYSRYDEPKQGSELSVKNEYHKVYYHKVGNPQSKDVLIYQNKDFPQRSYGASTTQDERYLILTEGESSHGNALYYKDLRKPKSDFVRIAEGFDNEYGVVDNIGDSLLIFTDKDAPKSRLVLINPANPQKDWKVIIPEQKEVLASAGVIGGKIIATYMKDACSKAYIYNLQGVMQGEVKLPGIGTLGGFSGEKDENIAFYTFTSFTFPPTIYKYDVKANTSVIYRKSEVDFNPDEYESKQVFFTSKDGTKVPMFIVHKKGIEMNGKNPTMLYGYGGFNISLTPDFKASRLVFLENGGVYVTVNLRGGGEYGEEWHQAGIKLKKQNVFDDFIAAAEYLIKNKYTSPEKLAIMGGSNGGLLVGACMTQRPDLFKVALPIVGVMDMLRYHKFTIGYFWASDYGTSEDSKEMFDYIYKYSPLHNIKEGVEYPATLVITADHDDRVVPAHSFKFIAALQEKYKGSNPVIIRIETMAGHGAGKPTSKMIDEATDMWAFTLYNLGVELK